MRKRKARNDHGLPLSRREESSRSSPELFAEYKDLLLPGETNFANLAVFADQDGSVVRLGAALFPAAFGFGDGVLPFLHRGFVAVDREQVFAGLQRSLAEFGGLRKTDGLGKRLGKSRHYHCECNEERRDARNGMNFHACHLSSRLEQLVPFRSS